MTVSIIIPVYNVAPYIERCLQSALGQTYQDLEVILVDDRGTDNSMELVHAHLVGCGYVLEGEKATSPHSPIVVKLLQHEHNRGLSAARNTGIEASTGEYIYFIDSDDWMKPNCIELMVDSVRRHPDVQMVLGGADYYGDLPNTDYTDGRFPEYSTDVAWIRRSMRRRFVFWMTAWNRLISRQFVMDNHLRFVEGLIYEDEVWNFDVAKNVTAIAILPHNTYVHELNNDGLSVVKSDDLLSERYLKMWSTMVSHLGGPDVNDQVEGLCNFIWSNTHHRFSKKYLNRAYLLLAKSITKMTFPRNVKYSYRWAKIIYLRLVEKRKKKTQSQK